MDSARKYVSELHFLTSRAEAAGFAAPAMCGTFEWTVVLVAKERSRLVTPAAAHHVRVPEFGIRLENRGGRFFLVADQLFTAIEFPRGRSNGLSHEFFSS